ncbi:MAG: hypothetical protein ACYC2I_06545 [Elusimicrobiales bacterium]
MKPYLLGLLLIMPPAVFGQAEPKVEISMIADGPRYHLALQRVAVGDCQAAPGPAQKEELAVVRVTVPLKWKRTAEHLAREKAAEIGANCLVPLYSSGEDYVSYPVRREYRAFRVVSGPYNAPVGPESIPAAAGGNRSPGPSGRMAFRPLKPPEKRDVLAWLAGKGVARNEIVVDLRLAGPDTLRDIGKDIEEYFPASEYAVFRKAAEEKRLIRIDLPGQRITVLAREKKDKEAQPPRMPAITDHRAEAALP